MKNYSWHNSNSQLAECSNTCSNVTSDPKIHSMGTKQPPETTKRCKKEALWILKDRLKEALWPLTKPQNQLRASNLAKTHEKTAYSTQKPPKTRHFWLPEPPGGAQRDPKRSPKWVPK